VLGERREQRRVAEEVALPDGQRVDQRAPVVAGERLRPERGEQRLRAARTGGLNERLLEVGAQARRELQAEAMLDQDLCVGDD
jgi:hypothetical protein